MHITDDILDAATVGDVNRMQKLISESSELVNQYGDEGWTPLHVAAFFGHRQVAEVLIASGADLHARSRNFMENMPLHTAVAGSRRDVVEMLLALGADVNARQDGGWTPLHEAALLGNTDLALLLIDHGAAINLRKDDGTTALGLAVEKGHKAMIELLRLHGGKE